MDKLKFELEYAAMPGVTVAFSVPFYLYGHQNPYSAADGHAVASIAEGLVAAAAATERSVPLQPKDAGNAKVASISLEGETFDMLRFEVQLSGDRTMNVFAPDYARATALAAVKQAFEGRQFADILDVSEEDLASAIQSSLAQCAASSHRMPVYCEFQVSDWRIAEEAADDLTEEQRQPMSFSLVRNAYGPEAVIKRGADEYSVAIEIDEGAVVARAYVPDDDNLMADVRIAKGSLQVGMSAGDESETYDVGENGIARSVDGKLKQDAPPAPTLAA